MRVFLICFSFLIVSAVDAQKKKLPGSCPDLKQKLQLIRDSFPNLKSFIKDRNSYSTSISICGVIGYLYQYKSYNEMNFRFKETVFVTETDQVIKTFVANFRKTVKAIFGSTYKERYDKEYDKFNGGYSEFYEYSPNSASNPRIRIDFSFNPDLDPIILSFRYEK